MMNVILCFTTFPFLILLYSPRPRVFRGVVRCKKGRGRLLYVKRHTASRVEFCRRKKSKDFIYCLRLRKRNSHESRKKEEVNQNFFAQPLQL
jgi:hypothetical protein